LAQGTQNTRIGYHAHSPAQRRRSPDPFLLKVALERQVLHPPRPRH
jgi:hypothetical protein